MDRYTPDQINGFFVDAGTEEDLKNRMDIVAITVNSQGHFLTYSGPDPTNGVRVKFNDATRTNDPVGNVSDGNYDYIYNVWTIFEVNTTTKQFRIKDETENPYKGIHTSLQPQNSYITMGYCEPVVSQPVDITLYDHLRKQMCASLIDGIAHSIYISSDTKFYDPEKFPVGWNYNEAELTDAMLSTREWNHVIIGLSYESIFAPYIIKKQIHKGKMTKLEIEVFRTLGGKIGTGNVGLDDKIQSIKMIELNYPSLLEEDLLYTGTIKPKIVGGFGDDPFFFLFINEAVPFNLTNVMYFLEAN